MKRLILSLLCVLVLVGCGNSNSVIVTPSIPEDNDQYEAIEIQQLSDHIIKDDYNTTQYGIDAYEKFATRLFKESIEKNKNEIISPFSLYNALAVLSNAADNDTRKELETVLGLTVNDMNNFLYVKENPWGKTYQSANGLWLNQDKGLSLNQDFVNTINEYYGIDTVKEFSFKDTGLIQTVNDWAKQKSDGAFDSILNDGDVDESTIMLLLNALATGDKWMFKFDKKDTYPQVFNCYDGTIKNVDMMHQQFLGYWHLDNAAGFVKDLENGIDVIGILPDRSIDIYDYINTMPSDVFKKMKESMVNYDNVKTTSDGWGCTWEEHITNLSFPKFNYENEYDLTTSLKKMGLKNIFDYTKSDFSNMADGNEDIINQLYVQKVKQKAMIEVNEEEVKAAAVTVMPMGMGGDGCKTVKTHYYDVVFDRPFIFCLYEYESGPIFIGVVSNLGQEVSNALGQIENIAGKINIRNSPSTKGEIVGSIEKGQKSFYFELKEAEGYTWYRIGDNKWIADKNGEWLKKAN